MNVLVSDSWSLGWVVGGPIAIVTLLVLLVVVIACFAFDEEGGGIIGGLFFGLIGTALLAFFLTPWGFYPFGGSDFHKYKVKSGEVSQISKRLVPSGDSMEEKIVVRFAGSNQEYGITDTRAALVEKGDAVIIKCKKSYDFGSIPGFDCKFVSSTPKAAS
jgi:hypothetical protein